MTVLVAKLRADLRLHPGRVFLVALAVLLGAAAVAGGLTARDSLGRAIAASFAASLPPQAILVTGEDTARTLDLLRASPEVAAVEPRRILRGRVMGADGHWASLRLTLLPDLDAQSVSRVVPLDAGRDGLLVERSGLPVWAGAVGEPMTIRLPSGREATLPTASLAADGAVAPGVQDRIVYVYATSELARARGLPNAFDEVHVRLAPEAGDTGAAIDALLDRLEAAGVEPARVERVLQRHPHADQMAAVLVLLTVFAAAALLVAGALVANVTATAMRAEGVQVGISRALGASRARLVVGNMLGLAVPAVPAAFVGAALGAFAARRFTGWAAAELNLLDPDLAPRLALIVIAAFLGAGLPLALAVVAAWRAASVLPLAAIYPERDVAPASASRLLAGWPLGAWIARATLARPLRLALVVLALALGGAALMTAANVYASLSAAVDRAFDARLDDLDVRLLAPAPMAELEAALDLPGVERGEVWGGLLVALVDEGGRQGGSRFGLLAPPRGTTLLAMPVAEGRWLGESDAFEVVASRNLLAREPSLVLGQDAALVYGQVRVTARLVGVTEEATEPGLFATQAVHDALAGGPGLGGALRVVAPNDPAAVSDRIEDRLFATGAVPALAFERTELVRATTDHFVILLVLLGTVAAVALVIGALGLASSVAASLLERRREVAMVRAMGAGDRRLMGLLVGEALALTVLAFALAIALALPLSAALAGMLGASALHIAVPLKISGTGIALWGVVAFALGPLAAAWPLRRLLGLPPAAALAYD